MTLTITGLADLRERLATFERNGPAIGRAAVAAGCAILAEAAKAAAPGSTKAEIGFYLRGKGTKTTGRVGFMQYPTPGQPKGGPHGIFLETGTKYILARHMVSAAMRQARPAALRAMTGNARKRIANPR